MKNLILLVSLLFITACSGGGGSSGSTDPIYGTWYYEVPGSTSSQARGIIASIEENKVFFAYVYAYSDGVSTVVYHRKTEGTYSRSGKVFNMNYSYETCNPVGSESLEITAEGDRLVVYIPSQGTGIQMVRSKSSSQIQSMMAIEDKNCNILSKMEKTDKRSVASEKVKSFFNGIKLK